MRTQVKKCIDGVCFEKEEKELRKTEPRRARSGVDLVERLRELTQYDDERAEREALL